jgi:glycogen synthase
MVDAAVDVGRAAAWLANLARSWGSDVVHLNQMAYPGAAPFGPPSLVTVHSDVFSWFSEVRGVTAPAGWEWYWNAVSSGLRAATHTAAPSRYQANLLKRHYRIADASVIHNGVDGGPAEEGPKPRSTSVVTAARAWDEAKGMRTFDDAITAMGDSAPDVHLFGGLDGPDGEVFRPLRLKSEGILSNSELRRRLQCATIYCAPSLYEPFGLAPAEAAAAGCALVLSDIGSFRELWDGCALFFPPGDSARLTDAIRSLMHDPERVAKLGAVSAARARERYSVDRFANDYLSLYFDLMRGIFSTIPLSTPLPFNS